MLEFSVPVNLLLLLTALGLYIRVGKSSDAARGKWTHITMLIPYRFAIVHSVNPLDSDCVRWMGRTHDK